ncbi:MAG TPA: hypothetical protein DCP92_04530 [Nitrospiraceae bacterium]|nr:hypothetical protein [Nitrospiraceae bacterium]
MNANILHKVRPKFKKFLKQNAIGDILPVFQEVRIRKSFVLGMDNFWADILKWGSLSRGGKFLVDCNAAKKNTDNRVTMIRGTEMSQNNLYCCQ